MPEDLVGASGIGPPTTTMLGNPSDKIVFLCCRLAVVLFALGLSGLGLLT